MKTEKAAFPGHSGESLAARLDGPRAASFNECMFLLRSFHVE